MSHVLGGLSESSWSRGIATDFGIVYLDDVRVRDKESQVAWKPIGEHTYLCAFPSVAEISVEGQAHIWLEGTSRVQLKAPLVESGGDWHRLRLGSGETVDDQHVAYWTYEGLRENVTIYPSKYEPNTWTYNSSYLTEDILNVLVEHKGFMPTYVKPGKIRWVGKHGHAGHHVVHEQDYGDAYCYKQGDLNAQEYHLISQLGGDVGVITHNISLDKLQLLSKRRLERTVITDERDMRVIIKCSSPSNISIVRR